MPKNHFQNQTSDGVKTRNTMVSRKNSDPDGIYLQSSSKAVQQSLAKFRKKISIVQEELSKINNKRAIFDERERLLKSKQIRIISKIKQTGISLDFFKELRDECNMQEDQMEQRAINNLFEMYRKN
ncbi:hypothetical protein GINT2_001605 [Glugoides intestinalis]